MDKKYDEMVKTVTATKKNIAMLGSSLKLPPQSLLFSLKGCKNQISGESEQDI